MRQNLPNKMKTLFTTKDKLGTTYEYAKDTDTGYIWFRNVAEKGFGRSQGWKLRCGALTLWPTIEKHIKENGGN